MNTNEIKKTLYEVLKGSPVTPGYDIEIWKDAQYPFIANVHYDNQTMYFVSDKEAQDIKNINDIKLL